ncbi:uncharacterized protein AC631_02918 [Debaryomyces fabryi]|uniref:Extracellular mutant protein 11 C-terminal domain-containing protein n=1 Tax=Debaryomyces fabryi TaxID=58627 RepID=A0A0V1PYP4_9ASCO|nr:uncharacterized protein AC631_02918 [Debaryomyces fabryi]KSA01353.1 hypothetical protein AC631_02918 [Debaryomyces fabryi]CUM46639.1 unnamed protein product [Debaryomyces fabryi]
MEIPTNNQLSQDLDDAKQLNHSFATSTPAHKQINHELTGVLVHDDQGENQMSPVKAAKRKNVLTKLLANPNGSSDCKNDTFDSTLTLEKPLSPIRTKQDKLHLSPLKHEVHQELEGFNADDELGALAATKFQHNHAPLSCGVEDETFDEALKNYAIENKLSLSMSFQEWVVKGLENAETQRRLIERLVLNRLVLLQRFQYLNDTINEYATSLGAARGDFDSKVKRIHVLTNEFLSDIA